VFPRIAREVPGCQFVFVGCPTGESNTRLFRARLERAFAAHGLGFDAHCVLLPRLDPARFHTAMGVADIFLNSISWSGFNTTMESLEHDLPIVSTFTGLMRGRHTLAILRLLELDELVAADPDAYVAIAARLARDAAWRTEVSRKIAERKHRLYRDRAAITALERFLDRVVRECPDATLATSAPIDPHGGPSK
jgi:predicted O-linked N-acetylglucosamine transferase (SPINDLY family)